MKLHRTTGQPDWATLNPQVYTVWQKIAAGTRGYVTPGNLVTIIGLALVALGLVEVVAENYWLGGLLIIIGRSLDLLDGWLAELTRTKSPLGEIMDASADKIGTFGAVIVLFVIEVVPAWVLLALLLPHVVITGISLLARFRRRSLHPSRAGKISMALLWVVIFGFLALNVYENGLLGMGVYAAAFVTVALTLYVAVDYGAQVRDRTAK